MRLRFLQDFDDALAAVESQGWQPDLLVVSQTTYRAYAWELGKTKNIMPRIHLTRWGVDIDELQRRYRRWRTLRRWEREDRV